ncbi:MAG: elongation factor P [Acidimicrobiia bacterium]
MAISTNDLKNGMTLELPDGLFTVLEFQHVKPGKGGAFVRTKLRNVRTGAVLDRTFRADEKVTQAVVEKREMQLLYREGGSTYVFMDNESFEQIPVPAAALGEAVNYLKDGDTVILQLYKGEIVGVDLPTAVELTVTHTEPGVQGDRSSAGRKPAVVETGLTVQVPLFVNIGDRIRVDTRTGEYITRV